MTAARRTWFRRLVQNPFVTAALCFLLWKDWSDWARRPPRDDFSPLLEHLFPRAEWAGRPTHPAPFAYVVRDGTQVRCIDPDTESWDELSTRVQRRPQTMATCALHAGRDYTGWWAPTRSVVTAEVRISPLADLGGFGSPSDGRDVARAAFIEWCNANARPQWRRVAIEVGPRDLSESTVLWSGYAHNAAAALVAAMALYSSAWVLRAATWLATLRSRRRLSRGLCVECGYDLRGTRGRCPECGGLTNPAMDYSHIPGQGA